MRVSGIRIAQTMTVRKQQPPKRKYNPYEVFASITGVIKATKKFVIYGKGQ